MTPLIRNRIDMAGAYSVLVYLGMLFVGWGLVAGFLTPPVSPGKSPDEIAEIFRDDTTRIRVGMVICMFAAMVFIPFTAVATKYVARAEGGPGVLTFTMLMGGVGNMVLSFYPPIMWLAVAFRPERDEDIMYMINDMAWLQFIGGVTMFLAMPLAILVVGLLDSSPEPFVPRWAAWASGWAAICIVCDQLLFFFTDGPFAWNGIIGLWVPVVFFGGYFILMFVILRAAILRDRARITADAVSDPGSEAVGAR